MTSLAHATSTGDPALLAAAARSVLACPSGVNLVVDGVDDVLGDLGEGAAGLGMQDLDGVPTFSCLAGTRLVDAATRGRRALLTLESGLGPVASPERDAVLTLGGRLVRRGRETCECCHEVRETVVLEVDVVVLTRPRGLEQLPVPLEQFRSTEHVLNAGFLQRSAEHANLCHQLELRRAVATTSVTSLAEVVGVALHDLAPDGVGIRWVDRTGAHQLRLAFSRRARSTAELGDLLREELHGGLC